jgi:hypothetical protein
MRRIALLAALALVLSASAAAASPPVALLDCLAKPTVRPRSVVLACADANFIAEHLRWTGWGSPFAAARGTASVNDCTPYCAAGHFHTYAIVLIAAGSQTCHGRRAYLTVTYAFIGRSPYPRGSVADATVPFRCR